MVGSVCSFMSIPGMSTYCASKYAQKGLCDAIKHEFESNGVRIHLFTPSTIDTPGLVEENKLKPKVTWEIEGQSTKISPDDAASVCLKGMASGKYLITTEYMIDLLSVTSIGCVARHNPIFELLLAPFSLLASMLFE